MIEKNEIIEANKTANIELYKEYNKSLRTWLVAYGIGLPALFITSKDAREHLINLNGTKCIIAVFLVAVAVQIISTILNKYVSWCAYYKESCRLNGLQCNNWMFKLAKLENCIYIDLVFDVLTVLLYLAATVLLLVANSTP